MTTPSTRYYAGIGSRRIPADICKLMSDVAEKLALRGLVLRSGGAEGADVAFEKGCNRVQGAKQIFYTDHWFNSVAEGYSYVGDSCYLKYLWAEAESVAARYHPYWSFLKPYSRKLMTRNSFQIAGKNLGEPAEFVLCWTPDAAVSETSRETGGTGQAIRIANALGIKVYNFANPKHLELAQNWLNK